MHGLERQHSPKPEVFSHNADLSTIGAAIRIGDINVLAQVWIGSVASVDRKLVIGVPRSQEPGAEVDWHHALYQYPRSEILVWPGHLKCVGAGFQSFVHSGSVTEPVFLSLSTVDHIPACSFVWRSWLWQLEGGENRRVQILLIIEHGPKPLPQVRALKAFWRLGLTQMIAFAALGSVHIDPGAALCDALV